MIILSWLLIKSIQSIQHISIQFVQVNVIKWFIKLPQTDTLKNVGSSMDPSPPGLSGGAAWVSLSVKINDLVWPTEDPLMHESTDRESRIREGFWITAINSQWVLDPPAHQAFIQCLTLLTSRYLQSALSLENFLISSFWMRQMRQSLTQAQVFGFLELSKLIAVWQQ